MLLLFFFFLFFLQLVKCCIIKSNRCVQMLSLTEGLYFILCPSCCDCCLLFSSSLLFSQLMVSLHHPHVYISSPPLPFLYYLFLTCSPLVSRFSLALSLALSSLSTSISPPPRLLPWFPREDWLANLAVYPWCLVVLRKRGQCGQHEDTTKRPNH